MSKVKITLVVLLAFLLTTNAMARHRMSIRNSWDGMLRTGFHIGVSGSFNSTWVINQNNFGTLNRFSTPIVRQSEMDYVFTWGGQVGVEIGYNFRKQWGIVFEPSYSWAGQKYDDNFSGPVDAISNDGGFTFQPVQYNGHASPFYSPGYKYVNVHRELHFNYIQLPIYIKFQTHIGDIANYYLMLGPQFNIQTNSSESIFVNHIFDSVATNQFKPDQRFQKFDVGLSINTGIEFYIKEWMYLNVGIVSFASFTDLNGTTLKEMTNQWYSKNDLSYQSSHSFYIGLHAGVHFYIGSPKYY